MKFLDGSQRSSRLVQSLFNHLYLSNCVVDMLVRICTIPDLQDGITMDRYNTIRSDILQHCINSLD
jgi:hypothetical protein